MEEGIEGHASYRVIREDPRSWDQQIPFLFANREVPNTTTGASPFRSGSIIFVHLQLGLFLKMTTNSERIHPTPNLSKYTSERVLHETDLNHLKETEREQYASNSSKPSYTIYK
ncbi:hypothetical protein TNCV_2333651 [Trichonephila clavipes]|nr:hypothetical protein TNCV_2333651 [Trichonephila clavipes]